MLPYNPKLKERARKLRSSMTDAEIALWAKLRRRQLNHHPFRRQKPIGNFIVDFYSPSANLVIEIDGGQHYTEKGQTSDAKRDAYLRTLGLRVLRFSNFDVLRNLESVIAEIIRYLEPNDR